MPKNNENYDPKEKITKIEADLYQPDKFATVFCNAAAKNKEIDLALKKIIKDLLLGTALRVCQMIGIRIVLDPPTPLDLKNYYGKVELMIDG